MPRSTDMPRVLAALLILAGLVCLAQAPVRGQIGVLGCGPARALLYQPCAGGVVVFTGPGDIVSGAKAWWGLRAYSTADRGNRLINVCNSTGGTDVGCADMNSDAVTGALVPATISGIPCPGTNCTIKGWYDRSGANACSASACDMINGALITDRATLVANCIGTLPCALFTRSSSQDYIKSPGFGVTAQPITISAVAARAGSFANSQSIASTSAANDPILFFGAPASTIGLFNGSSLTATATDGNFHALQAVFNGASSVISVNGTPTTGAGGATGITNVAINIGNDNFADFLDGKVTEVGWWFIAFSSPQQTNMCHNQFAYWGTSVSC